MINQLRRWVTPVGNVARHSSAMTTSKWASARRTSNDQPSRELGQLAGMTLAAVSLGACTSPQASTPSSADAHTSFASLKQIDAGLLNIGYAEDGPPEGKPVILLHGWPYDIHSYVDVAPALAAQGYRVIVPFLRGYGTTTFRSADTFRNGQQSAVALDIIALMDALNIPKAVIGGFDWGSRTAGDHRSALARTMQSAGRRQRLPDHQSGGQPQAAAARSRIRMVVPVLLRHRARRRWLPAEHPRLQQAHLENRLTEVELR